MPANRTVHRVRCPTCQTALDFVHLPEIGRLLRCSHCGDIARVVQQQPPRLAFAFEEPDIQPRTATAPTLHNR